MYSIILRALKEIHHEQGKSDEKKGGEKIDVQALVGLGAARNQMIGYMHQLVKGKPDEEIPAFKNVLTRFTYSHQFQRGPGIMNRILFERRF